MGIDTHAKTARCRRLVNVRQVQKIWTHVCQDIHTDCFGLAAQVSHGEDFSNHCPEFLSEILSDSCRRSNDNFSISQQGSNHCPEFLSELLSDSCRRSNDNFSISQQSSNQCLEFLSEILSDSCGRSNRDFSISQQSSSQYDQVVEPTDATTLSQLLKHQGKRRAVADGRLLHNYICTHGYERRTFIANCIVEMYGNCGFVEDAQAMFHSIINPDLYSWNILIKALGQNGDPEGACDVFHRMPHRDIVSWTVLISAFAQNGQGREALETFHEMQSEGMEPSNVTFMCVLEACASSLTLEDGQKLHDAAIEYGYMQDMKVGNAIIKMYGKCGCVEKAQHVFHEMPYKNVISWTVYISALAKNGRGQEAIGYFYQMLAEGFTADKVLFVCLLDTCASLEALVHGQQIHAAVVDFGFESDVFVGTALVNLYGKCQSTVDARSIFDQMQHRDIVCWNTMTAILAQNWFSMEALNLCHTMYLRNILPNKVTFICALDACAGLADYQIGQVIHATIIEMGFEQHDIVGTALISLYRSCGSIFDVTNIFSRMTHKNVSTWNAVISILSQNCQYHLILGLFHQMQIEGLKPDCMTLVCVLETCASFTALKEGQKIHAAIIFSDSWQDVSVVNSVIDMYGKNGSIQAARTVFNELQCKDIVSWTSMIAACALNGHGIEALDLYHRMQIAGIGPNDITCICLLNACSHAGLVYDGRLVFASIEKEHVIACSIDHYLCMVDLLGRAGHLEEAEGLIQHIPATIAVDAWVSLLAACKVHGDVERGLHAANMCVNFDPYKSAPYVIVANLYAEVGSVEDTLNANNTMAVGTTGQFLTRYTQKY